MEEIKSVHTDIIQGAPGGGIEAECAPLETLERKTPAEIEMTDGSDRPFLNQLLHSPVDSFEAVHHGLHQDDAVLAACSLHPLKIRRVQCSRLFYKNVFPCLGGADGIIGVEMVRKRDVHCVDPWVGKQFVVGPVPVLQAMLAGKLRSARAVTAANRSEGDVLQGCAQKEARNACCSEDADTNHGNSFRKGAPVGSEDSPCAAPVSAGAQG